MLIVLDDRPSDSRDTMPQLNAARRPARRRPHYLSPPTMAISKPSKSAKKREFLALQALGEELIGLTHEQIVSIGLDTSLLEAVLVAKSITSRGALRRQKQLIGKLMRRADPEPIRSALQAVGINDRTEKEVFRRAEDWRDRIADEGPAALRVYFELLGHKNHELTAVSKSLGAAQDDRIRRELRRRIFREIHRDLLMKVQNDRN